MILEFILNIIITIAQTILGIISALIPGIDIAEYMNSFITELLKITTQANNMIHFLLGNFCEALVGGALLLLTFKYVVYPIVSTIRSIFINGNT